MAKRLTPFSKLLITIAILICGFFLVRSIFFGSSTDNSIYEDSRSAYEKGKDEIKEAIDHTLKINGVNSILIADYLDLDNKQDKFGRYLAEDLSALFSSSRNEYKVVDRSRLKTLLEEQNLRASGLLDQKTVSELGKIIGVDAVITGKYQKLGEYLKIWIKVTDIEKAELILTKDVKILIDGELKEASKINSWW